MAPRYALRRLEDVPQVTGDPDEPRWFPLQHHFGLTAFGANVYVAEVPGEGLIGDHDETGSDQEELYVVTAGEATFTLDGEDLDAPAVTVVAVPDPAVRRLAVAKTAGTTILAVGGARRPAFRSSWHPSHFENVAQL